LLHYTTSGALVPGLATSAAITDPSTVNVQIRPGLVFSNGTPLDANAVKTSILRNQAAPQHGQFDQTLRAVSSIDVTSPTSLAIHLSKPEAGAFYALLAGPETYVSAPAATDLARSPIGAGPFMLKNYVPQQRIVLVKNPRYWDAADIHLSEIDISSVAAGPQQVNAIESGQVDFTLVQPSDFSAIRSASSLRLLSRASGSSLLWMPLCKSGPPLNKVQVRQALSHAIDRQAINQSLLQGAGEPADSFWPQESVFFPKSLAGAYAYDPTKAKQLLAQAGYPNGFNLTLIQMPVPIVSQAAQIIQSEWKAIGVNLKIRPSASYVNDLYVNHLGQTGINPGNGAAGVAKLSNFRPGFIGDLCNYDNPQLDAITTQLGGLAPTSPTAVNLWASAQTIISQNVLAIYIDFQPVGVATSSHVQDANLVTSYLLTVPDYHTIRIGG
jgi:ABC-type transport system substrate-binding protein